MHFLFESCVVTCESVITQPGQPGRWQLVSQFRCRPYVFHNSDGVHERACADETGIFALMYHFERACAGIDIGSTKELAFQ
jgi:hypothetical protein